MGQTIFGFDSAWTDNPRAPGAICALRIDGGTVSFGPPELCNFGRAAKLIRAAKTSDEYVLVALDQPTIVPNASGGRPVEKVAASVISAIRGGVQPSSRSRKGMFDDTAPVWRFLREIECVEEPKGSRSAEKGAFLIEVFPALALASLVPATWSRRSAAKYNPANRNFSLNDWVLVCTSLELAFLDLNLPSAAHWCSDASQLNAPNKAAQDKLDAMICLLVGLIYRLGGCGLDAVMIGDLETGYMFTPATKSVSDRLMESANKRSIDASVLKGAAPLAAPLISPLVLRQPNTVEVEKRVSPTGAFPQSRPNGEQKKVRSPSRSNAGKTTQLGYKNRNQQQVEKRTDLPGNDHNQFIYVLRCKHCSYAYGVNGSDIFQRKCPRCQGGAPGLGF